jgi:TrpR-related protein YerC/YecD
MENELNSRQTKELFTAISQIESPSEAKQFFRDLCTFSELNAMAERWQVAQKLDKKIPYRKIAQETGSSTATVTRVAHWIHHGMGGYKLLLSRKK